MTKQKTNKQKHPWNPRVLYPSKISFMNQRQVNIFSSKIKLRRFFTNKTVPEKEKNTLGCSLG